MSGIYDDMQNALAYEVENFSSQGALIYIESGAATGPAWDPQPEVDIEHACNGWNITGGKRNKYIAGGYIQSSDVLLSVVPFDIDPTLDGRMSINGVEHQIVMVDPATINLSAPVVWRIGCRK